MQWYKVDSVVCIKGVFGHARGLYLGRRVKHISCFSDFERSFDWTSRKRAERSERSGSQMMVRDVLLLHDTNVAADFYGTPQCHSIIFAD